MEYSHPSISVVIPVTKMSGQLKNLEASIQDADPKHFQIIIVHDNRDAETWRELSALVEKYNYGHLIAINGFYGSAGATRNEGMKHAKNDLITFWDSDDIGNISSLAQVARENDWKKYSAVASSFTMVDKKEISHDYVFGDDKESNEYAIAAHPGIWRWIFKKDSLNHSFENYSMGEDQLFLASNLEGLNIRFSSTVTYCYFANIKNQATADIGLKKVEDLSRVSQELRKLLCHAQISNLALLQKMDVSIKLSLLKYSKGVQKFRSSIYVIAKLKMALKILRARKLREIK